MTKQEWLNQARRDRDLLVSLVRNYHPANVTGPGGSEIPITAPNAEAACEVVRKKLKHEYHYQDSPVVRFEKAIDDGYCTIVNDILNQTWFGVPESVDCWNIKGFTEAVKLMEDPPEDEDERRTIGE